MNRFPSSMNANAAPFRVARARSVALRMPRADAGLWQALPLALSISGGLWAMGVGIAMAALHHL